jgi:putative addiction module component (TIGR02574 family)
MTDKMDTSHLDPMECITLAEQLGEQARAHPEAIPLAAQQEELDRRLAALENGELPSAETWEEVEAWLQSR